MTTTYPLTLPSLTDFETMVWGPMSVIALSRSPFSGVTRAMDWGGRIWVFRCMLSVQNELLVPLWQSTLLQLEGTYGTFYFGDPKRTSPHGTWTAASINGSNQSGETLILDGTGNAKTAKRGDNFQLESNLYMVKADAVSDASGNMSVDVWPPVGGGIRPSPTDNAVLTLTNPLGIFRLLNPFSFNATQTIYEGAEFFIVEEPQV